VTISLGTLGVRGVVLDIEGTTTPVAFVYDVLFPYARAQLHDFLASHASDGTLDEVARLLQAEHAADVAAGESPPPLVSFGVAEAAGLAGYVLWLMDRDRKSPGLKLLQGLIWERGFASGALRSELFPDVAPALERWRAASIDTAIYSSGSVLAQRLIFAHTSAGDLTPCIGHFFDTAVGAKRSPDSYRRIATAMGRAPGELLFLSDVHAELDAARAARLQAILCVRPGNAEPAAEGEAAISSFEEIVA